MHLPLDELALVTLQKILHCDYFWDQQICSKIGAATLMNEPTSVGGTPREKPSRATANSNPTHESPRARLELASCQTRNDKTSGPRAQPSSAATLISARHGFANPHGYPGMGSLGTGTGLT